MSDAAAKAGLEGVVASDSSICYVDGKEGRLLYQGYDIDDLALHSTFEETAYLLWHGRLPNRTELQGLKDQLVQHRPIPDAIQKLLQAAPQSAEPMAVLRTAASALAMFDGEGDDMSPETNVRRAVRLTAAFPTVVAAFERIRNGQEPVQPDPSLDHAANFLYMIEGETPDPRSAAVLDMILVLHADHELNASTFAARVTAATLSDMYSAVTSAIGALKGPLHGGANERVLEMLFQIGNPDDAADWIKAALARRDRIMGFGHRVYKTMDPRAVHLRKAARELGERVGDTRWIEMSEIIEGVMLEEKGLYPNVDFYAASAYHGLGIEKDLFTPIFAVSRVSGWTAHVLEQYADNRLIRPRSNYTGPMNAKYVGLDERD